MKMTMEIIDKSTGMPVSDDLTEQFAKEYGLMEMDIDQFAITQDGHIVLLDECGQYRYVDEERYGLRADVLMTGRICVDGNDD